MPAAAVVAPAGSGASGSRSSYFATPLAMPPVSVPGLVSFRTAPSASAKARRKSLVTFRARKNATEKMRAAESSARVRQQRNDYRHASLVQ